MLNEIIIYNKSLFTHFYYYFIFQILKKHQANREIKKERKKNKKYRER